jgi:dTDP-glucose 4,6-dehydratase
VRHLVLEQGWTVLTLDSLTYAGHLASLAPVMDDARHTFQQGDITVRAAVDAAFAAADPDIVFHLAAESHVDRSIDGPDAFVQTNVVGTFTLLEAARAHYAGLSENRRTRFRFIHVSTDEVFGSLGSEGLFDETTPYDPRSPYSATKAASDHLARAWFHTHGLPVCVSNCSNNYGPCQTPEKLVPLTILNALEGRPLPVYGTGANVRDWLHVDDHVTALVAVALRGQPGRSYAVGGHNERRNIEVVEAICSHLDQLHPQGAPHRSLIRFVADRPGHDARYAIDPARIRTELGWQPRHSFETGLEQTVRWYLERRDWWEPLRAAGHGLARLGLSQPGPVTGSGADDLQGHG